jgi:hypothetical protein
MEEKVIEEGYYTIQVNTKEMNIIFYRNRRFL